MPAFISSLDGNYISLKRAALLIAREQPGIEPDDIMELFKHAIFTCEFEREACGIHGIGPTDDRNLPLVRSKHRRETDLFPVSRSMLSHRILRRKKSNRRREFE